MDIFYFHLFSFFPSLFSPTNFSFMKKMTLFFAAVSAFFAATAQNNTLHQVIVMNEGVYNYTTMQQDVPVTIGAYNPNSKTYHIFDTIEGSRFSTEVLVENGVIYAAADNKINMYDANNYQLLHTASVPGVRAMAIWNNHLLVSRGEYLVNYNSYFQVYDKNNLSFVYELPVGAGPDYASDKIVVKGDSAYVAVNNGFDWGNYKGLIGVVNLNGQTYTREITLTDSATNPENLMLAGNQLLTVNNNDFSKSSVSVINPMLGANSSKLVVNNAGCATSALSVINGNPYVLYQAFGDNQLGKFDVTNNQVASPVMINKGIYGIAVNPINNEIYTGVTDFVSFGKVYIHYANGFPRDSFNVSVNPSGIAFDLRQASGLSAVELNNQLTVVNNLVTDQLVYSLNSTKNENLSIVSADGKVVKTCVSNANATTNTVNVSDLSAGVYMLKWNAASTSIRFVKQ